MTTQTEALKLALEALETAWYHVGTFCPTDEAIELYDDARAAIKEALAQPEHHTLTSRVNDVRFHKERDEQRAEAMKMLVQPEQEPVAFICQGNVYMADDVDEYCTAKHIPLYTKEQL